MNQHLLKRSPGIPGVYDTMQCVQCGFSARVSPSGVHFGAYLPLGNLRLPEKCNHALDEDVPEYMLHAYQELFKLYQQHDALRAYVPDIQGGAWVIITVGVWGTPKLVLWNGWYIEIDQTAVAIWHDLPEGCGCGSKPCSPRVVLSPQGEAVFVSPHGLLYSDQTNAPIELTGWEQFKGLAMLMYTLPQPFDPKVKWFGRTWKSISKACEQYASQNGSPLWKLWEESGKEMAWIYANFREAVTTSHQIDETEYNTLKGNHPDAPGINAVYEEDDDGNVIPDVPPRYYEKVTTLRSPITGTKIHFQTGHTAASSSSFKAQIYRATWMGCAWKWEISKETYAENLRDRVYGLLDDDYQPTTSPQVGDCHDWLVEVPK